MLKKELFCIYLLQNVRVQSTQAKNCFRFRGLKSINHYILFNRCFSHICHITDEESVPNIGIWSKLLIYFGKKVVYTFKKKYPSLPSGR